MKKIVLMLAAAMAVCVSAEAKTVRKTFQAEGQCEMCKDRIQKSAKAVDGVLSAAWNVSTKTCTVVFDDSKTDLKKIEQAVANAGHDTADIKATAEAYGKLPGCCKYRK